MVLDPIRMTELRKKILIADPYMHTNRIDPVTRGLSNIFRRACHCGASPHNGRHDEGRGLRPTNIYHLQDFDYEQTTWNVGCAFLSSSAVKCGASMSYPYVNFDPWYRWIVYHSEE